MLGPIFVLGVIGAIVLLFMRRVHRKRLLAQRIKLDPETYYANDDLLRATAAGDSTLRVRHNFCYAREKYSRIFVFFFRNIWSIP